MRSVREIVGNENYDEPLVDEEGTWEEVPDDEDLTLLGSELSETDRDLDELEERAEVAEDALEAVESFGGDIHPQAIRLLAVHFNSAVESLGLESFKDNEPEAAIESLKDTVVSIKNWVSQVIERLIVLIKEVWRRITNQVGRLIKYGEKLEKRCKEASTYNKDATIESGNDRRLYWTDGKFKGNEDIADYLKDAVKKYRDYLDGVSEIPDALTSIVIKPTLRVAIPAFARGGVNTTKGILTCFLPGGGHILISGFMGYLDPVKIKEMKPVITLDHIEFTPKKETVKVSPPQDIAKRVDGLVDGLKQFNVLDKTYLDIQKRLTAIDKGLFRGMGIVQESSTKKIKTPFSKVVSTLRKLVTVGSYFSAEYLAVVKSAYRFSVKELKAGQAGNSNKK